MTTKSKRLALLVAQLTALGFSLPEIQRLRRIQSTLHRWAEAECNGEIQRDEDNDNRPYRQVPWDHGLAYIPDREAGALKRLAAIMNAHPKLWAYHQTDPRGAALYVGKRADLKTDENQVVKKAREWRAHIWDMNTESNPVRAYVVNHGPAHSEQLPGTFDTEEAAAIAYLKHRGASIPARDLLPLDQYYTRGIAVY